MNAVAVAGGAMATHPQFNQSGEPKPENAYSGSLAAAVAKAAEKAAQAARTDGEDSRFAVCEAWDYTTNAAADHAEIVNALRDDFAKLHRAAYRGKWTDRTTIPSEIWTLL